MSAFDRWARVRSVLEDVVGRPAAERAAYLSANVSDPEIRREVESLLRAHDDAGDFLEASPAVRTGVRGLITSVQWHCCSLAGSSVRFEILGPVGAGGMGQVYRARDTRLDRTVAVKIIAPTSHESPSSRERFEREARAISRLTHPHVCVLHDVGVADLGEEGERQFLVMELVEGQTLRERLDRGALPLAQALGYGVQIADALAAAHNLQIVHGDLKPANVVLTKSGVKLLDFGLATFLRQPETPQTADGRRPQAMGLIAGTLPYMSPEQLEGKAVDARSDIFSFGAVLYEMVTGRKAFEGQSRSALMSAILSAPYSSGALTPRSLDAVVETCLAKDPDNRWSNMHDVRLQLRGILQEATAPVVERTTSVDRRSPGLWVRVAPWAVAALFGIGWILARGDRAREKSSVAVSTQRHSVELGAEGSLAHDRHLDRAVAGRLVAGVRGPGQHQRPDVVRPSPGPTHGDAAQWHRGRQSAHVSRPMVNGWDSSPSRS